MSGAHLQAPAFSFAYDRQSQITVAYDGSGESVVGYDAVLVLVTGEANNGTTGNRVHSAKFAEFLAAEGTAPKLFYHYTTADESLFANGLREGSSVTDKLYTDALHASQELGIPVPNKVIPIQDVGQFIPAKPPTVQPSFRFLGGGNDFNNIQRVPPSQLLPAQPIGR